MSNFEFLREDFSELYEYCLEAEENCYKKPRTSAFYSRIALETCVALIYKFERLALPYNMDLNSLINNFEFKKLFETPAQIEGINFIRKFGNDAAHVMRNITSKTSKITTLSKEVALNSLKNLFDLTLWLGYCYGSLESDEIKFNENYIEKDQDMKEEELVNILVPEKIVETKINSIEEIPDKKHDVPLNMKNYDEAETRRIYIDSLLEQAGWKVGTENVSIEYEVEGLASSKSGKGRIDYALIGDNGLPLAIVEAKKESINAKKGEFQALEYAEILEKKFNLFPVRYLTNGFEIFMYDDKNSIPRKVYGFYKKEELLKLIDRRNRKLDGNVEIDRDITDRFYQEIAIKKAIENYISGSRKSLLIMATGSGKTRVAISIVNSLSKLGLVRRILFLADRVALVSQAMNNFKKLLPDYTYVNLVEEKDKENARVVFSTYQSMMSETEKINSSTNMNKYGVGAFDLIIIDEAHRSIYQKYGDLFEYYDALLLGLTATPKDEVDRNTYKVFGMESKEPTYSYDLFEAAKNNFLLLPNFREISLGFPEDGIVYSQLSEEDKEKYEELFDEEQAMPEEISADSLNTWFFNEGTTKEVLNILMEKGYKIESGDKLGKTIIFAKNDRHADHIVEVFNKTFKNLGGDFCQKITTKVEKVQELINRFVDPKNLPQIAVSVDMLDTGIDVPEILNLVFYKKIRSKAKFWQMIGRGTRKCENLFGIGRDKESFLILDFCKNFSYFELKDSFKEDNTKLSESLTSKIFSQKIKLMYALQDLKYQTNEQYKKIWLALVEEVHKNISSLNEENISVKLRISYVKKYSDIERLKNLDENMVQEIIENLRMLPYGTLELKESEKKFENLILKAQLNLTENKKVIKETEKIRELAKTLSKKGNIKKIQENAEKIQRIIENEVYFENVDILSLEELKKEFSPLVIYLDDDGNPLNYIVGDLKDTLREVNEKDINLLAGSYLNSKEKFQKYLEQNKEILAIKKLRSNIELDGQDIKELKQLLYKNSEISITALKEENRLEIESYKKDYNEDDKGAFGIFLRSLVGLDREAINKEFSTFLNREKFNSNQIELINLIIENIVKYSAYKINDIPKISNNFFGKSIDNIFTQREDLIKIVEIVQKINKNVPHIEVK